MDKIVVKRALISVFNKDGVIDFARFLSEKGVEILSTGGTYTSLTEAGIKCIKIEDYTGQKEIFGGRVKTLHPLIHGGILSKRDKESDDLGMKTIDMVIVNLYPFESVVEKGVKELSELIEMIDIGGPTMLRSCAKNYKFACPVCSPEFYEIIKNEISSGGISLDTRMKMAIEVLKATSYYDNVISMILNEFQTKPDAIVRDKFNIPFRKEIDMRYGENPHQNAGFYASPDYADKKTALFYSEGKLHGKELSYNNIADTSGAMRILTDLEDNSCVVIKHSNPCGASSKGSVHDSFMAAYEGDKVSIFGGIVAVKGDLEEKTALVLKDIFLEIVVARSFTPKAFEILSQKKNIRLLEYKKWEKIIFADEKIPEIKKVIGGFLVQDKDNVKPLNEEKKVVTSKAPTKNEMEDLIFAQTLVKHAKSNAIVVVKDKMLIGVGTGQMNRVTSARIALDWAGEKTKGAVIGSDAFFPMDDTVKLAGERGIKAIAQPGGSLKDEDSIKACNDLGISMIFTGVRHFYH